MDRSSDNFHFVALDDHQSVVDDLCDQVSKNMEATGLRLPTAWSSIKDLLGYVYDLQPENHRYIIYLKNEMSREDFSNGSIWQEFLDEVKLIDSSPAYSPLEHSILPLIPMKIENLYFSFTNPSLFMLLTLSLILLLVHFVTKKVCRYWKRL